MEISDLKLQVEDVLANPLWPSRWPYGFEDFRPLDYTRDDVINTGAQYEFSQSLIMCDHVTLIPGILRFPIRRHFIFPKDKFALSEHMSQYFFDGAKVLELFSCYESILPPGSSLGATVGVGWYGEEMKCNADLDDYIVQDITVDPFLPLADNYFDFVVVPANFQLLQRPLDMFREINRVLKPGGMAIVGLKLSLYGFLGWKQGRYFVETNYLEVNYLRHPSYSHSPITNGCTTRMFSRWARSFTTQRDSRGQRPLTSPCPNSTSSAVSKTHCSPLRGWTSIPAYKLVSGGTLLMVPTRRGRHRTLRGRRRGPSSSRG